MDARGKSGPQRKWGLGAASNALEQRTRESRGAGWKGKRLRLGARTPGKKRTLQWNQQWALSPNRSRAIFRGGLQGWLSLQVCKLGQGSGSWSGHI